LRHLGKTTIAISQLSFPFVLIVIGHYYAHQTFYETLLLAGVIVLGATLAVLYLPFVELHRHLKTVKKTLLEELQSLLEDETTQFMIDRKTPQNGVNYGRQLSILASAALYSQAERLNTWPYVGFDHVKWVSIVSSPVIAFLLKRFVG